MLRPLFTALMALLPLAAQAQGEKDGCGDLRGRACGLLRVTMDRWNDLYGDKVRLEGFHHAGKADSEDVYRLYSASSESRALAIDPESGQPRVMTIGEMMAGSPNTEVTRDRIARFGSAFTDRVTMTWSENGNRFETTALVGDSYPFLLDTMIASVIIAVQPTSTTQDATVCMAYRYTWVNAIEVGACNANIYSESVRSPLRRDEHRCDRHLYAYNNFGGHAAEASDFTYNGGSCEITVKCGFTSPFATISIQAGTLDVSVDGMGWSWTVDRTCRLP